MSRQTFKQSDLERACRSVIACGLKVEAVEIAVDGSLRVLTSRPAPGVALNDDEDWVALAGTAQDHGRA